MSKIIFIVIIFLALLFQFPQIAQAAIIIPPNNQIVISDFGELLVGESKPVTVSRLIANVLYYWIETDSANIPTFIGCIRADGNGVINETIGPYSKAGTYHLAITLATSASVEGKGSTLPPPNCDPEVPTNPAEADFNVVSPSAPTPTVEGTAEIVVSPDPALIGTELNISVAGKGFATYMFYIVPEGETFSSGLTPTVLFTVDQNSCSIISSNLVFTGSNPPTCQLIYTS